MGELELASELKGRKAPSQNSQTWVRDLHAASLWFFILGRLREDY